MLSTFRLLASEVLVKKGQHQQQNFGDISAFVACLFWPQFFCSSLGYCREFAGPFFRLAEVSEAKVQLDYRMSLDAR